VCDQNKISRYELIEVQITQAAAGQVNFPSAISTLQNNPERKIFITGLEIFPIYAQANSITQNAVGGLPVTEIPKFSVTLYYDGANFIRSIPAAKLINTVPPAGVASPYQWQPLVFNNLYPVAIDQCFLQFTTAPAPTYVVPIGVSYIAQKIV
jgi:hypothetical protein